MTARPAPMAEILRGTILESRHAGHAAICDASGAVLESWGDPDTVILPRSAVKMIQALPLVTSGAAAEAGLGPAQLALACASHQGAPMHVAAVEAWLAGLGLDDGALCCGPQPSRDRALRHEMIRAGRAPGRVHNNCSGKHAGFLTLNRRLGGGPRYVDPDHPVTLACRDAFETVTGLDSPGWGVDGCSAPNFATTLHGMARAMAWFASASMRGDSLSRAAAQLVEAMIAHPELVAGEERACTDLMRAAQEPAALKTGAEGVFAAILPQRGIGIAVKIADGAERAAECAIAALLVRLGVLEATDPAVLRWLNPPIRSWAGEITGEIRPAEGLMGQPG